MHATRSVAGSGAVWPRHPVFHGVSGRREPLTGFAADCESASPTTQPRRQWSEVADTDSLAGIADETSGADHVPTLDAQGIHESQHSGQRPFTCCFLLFLAQHSRQTGAERDCPQIWLPIFGPSLAWMLTCHTKRRDGAAYGRHY
jgi:hypothetical protein